MRAFRSTVVAAVLVMAGVLAGACGSAGTSSNSSTSSPSPTPTPSPAKVASVDACSLVMVTEASTIAGTPVTNMAGASGVQVPGACFYGSADGKGSVLVFAQAFPDSTSANAVSPQQIAAAMNGTYGVANAKTVSGIGDKAVEYNLTGAASGGLVIFVVKSNVLFMIAVVPSPPDSTALENLARTAAGRF
ncbi:MAG TPA: hypothetical protein VLR46_12005 [Candidatus Dormibacteraeota bacterium]|nr:hypothetical protein [Candidatus Dormibacteraeota bacterium]